MDAEAIGFDSLPGAIARDSKVVVLVTSWDAYFDESGCQPGSKVFILGGYVASRDTWDKLNARWNAVLAEDPEIPYWHTSHAHCRKGPFDHMSAEEVERKESRLVGVLCSYSSEMRGLSVRLPIQNWRARVEGRVVHPHASIIERPHSICYHEATANAVAAAHVEGHRGVVNFVFEKRDGDPYQGHVLAIHNLLSAFPEGYWAHGQPGSLSFIPGKQPTSRPLEAADMLAWHLNRRTGRHGEDEKFWHELTRTRISELSPPLAALDKYVAMWSHPTAPGATASDAAPAS